LQDFTGLISIFDSELVLSRQMAKRYHLSPEMLTIQWENLNDDELLELGDKILEWDSFDMILQWVEQRKKKTG